MKIPPLVPNKLGSDRVERAFLWQKHLDSGVDGCILTVIKDTRRRQNLV